MFYKKRRDKRVFVQLFNLIIDIIVFVYGHTSIFLKVFMLFGGDLLVLADDTVMLLLTTGKDYYVLVVRWLTLGQTQPIHIQMVYLIYHSHSIYYCEFCFN